MAGTLLLGSPPIASGWNTLPLGCGGLVTGMHIANDGTMVCRSDVGNIYRWSGKSTGYADKSNRWVPLLNFTSLGGSATMRVPPGGWEHVLAPGNSAVHLAIFPDIASVSGKSWVYYSTNSGGTWGQSNLAFTGSSAAANGSMKVANYKIAIDPNNANVAYCGMPASSGNTAGAYTTLNQSGGSTLATWASVKTSGATPIDAVSNTISCGLAIDATSGTTTVGGQTVTNRIIIPVGGVGIFESTDGGVTFAEVASATIGTADFYVTDGGFTAEGIYYCIVVHATAGGIWRYRSGTWAKISAGTYSASSFVSSTKLIIDPRDNPTSKAYLSVTGPNGAGAGFTSTNANTATAASVAWTGLTNQQRPNLLAASYDIPYLNYIFGQQVSPYFTAITCAVVDASGNCFFPGNQSLWYFGTSNVDSTSSGPPTYANTTSPATFVINAWSMGRGMECTVSQDALCPPGGTYPILAPQDLGAPMRGTFTTYPKDLGVHYQEYNCSSIEYAANDPSFVVACTAGQFVNVTSYLYSQNYGADGTWNTIAQGPDSLWNGGGTSVNGGQIVAVDRDHWVAVPQGLNGNYQPAYTTNATGAANWSSCSGLPSAKWMMTAWFSGLYVSKPFAVGYGTDQGTVWACLFVTGSTTATLYRSTDSGATFSSVATWTISSAAVAVYCYSVPGVPDELWITASYSGGSDTNLWHVTGARTAGTPTVTAITNLPALAALPFAFTLGAPSTPGGYPALYLLGWASSGAAKYLYRGTYSGTGTTPTWALFGPTGTSADLPASCQLCGIQSIRGDWNVYGRLYASSNQNGFAYYNQ